MILVCLLLCDGSERRQRESREQEREPSPPNTIGRCFILICLMGVWSGAIKIMRNEFDLCFITIMIAVS